MSEECRICKISGKGHYCHGDDDVSESSETAGYVTGKEINEAGMLWLKENPNYGVPYSMTEGYWNCVKAALASWGFKIVKGEL